ncbi:hypothetical protein GOB57_08615 [Sinorhizobium meliloti]|nr:hypothetical protein [Sinorhizobium meliloti]
MDFLSKDRLVKWRSVQPKDVAAVTEDPASVDPAFVELVANRLPTLKTADAVLNFVGERAEEFRNLGRAGRLRFVAWVLAQKYSDESRFLNALVCETMPGEEEDGDAVAGGDGRDKIAPFFYSDILAFAEALGPRIAAQIVDAQTLDAVAGASLEVASEFEMKGRM